MSESEISEEEYTPLEQALINAAQFSENCVAALAYVQGVAELDKMRTDATSSYQQQTIAAMEQVLESTLPIPSSSYDA